MSTKEKVKKHEEITTSNLCHGCVGKNFPDECPKMEVIKLPANLLLFSGVPKLTDLPFWTSDLQGASYKFFVLYDELKTAELYGPYVGVYRVKKPISIVLHLGSLIF